MRKPFVAAAFLALLAASSIALGQAAQQASVDKAEAAIERGLAYLASQQAPAGDWQASRGAPAITALALKGFAQSEKHRNDANVQKGFEKLLSFQMEDGGIYKDTLASYNTALAISALAKANNPAYGPAIEKAVRYLRSLQWSDTMDGLPKGEKVPAGDPRIGGWGYGSKGRPDGSNTSFALDALKDAGVSESDPAFKAAAAFMSNCQNTESNRQPWASNDGGFIYSLHDGGETFAGATTRPDGVKVLQSYGTMTYAGLKSLVYAGISRDDPPVVAAFGWISTNWSLTENPNMRTAGADKATDGIYYYYHILARSLHAYGRTDIPSTAGSLDWRTSLIDRLTSLQAADGSWTGGRAYMENNPVLVTAYSVLALQEAAADLRANAPK